MQILCVGIRRAGMTTVAYVENGRVIIKAMPANPPKQPQPLPETVERHA